MEKFLQLTKKKSQLLKREVPSCLKLLMEAQCKPTFASSTAMCPVVPFDTVVLSDLSQGTQ